MSASGRSDKQSATPESTKKQVTVKVSDNNIKNTGKKKPRSAHPDVVCTQFTLQVWFVNLYLPKSKALFNHNNNNNIIKHLTSAPQRSERFTIYIQTNNAMTKIQKNQYKQKQNGRISRDFCTTPCY